MKSKLLIPYPAILPLALIVSCFWPLSGNSSAAETVGQDTYTAGGQILDTQNQPLAGFRIHVYLSSKSTGTPFPVISGCTDSEGKWVSDPIPSDVKISHIEIEYGEKGETQQIFSVDNIDNIKLRDHTFTIILAKKIRGIVRNQEGEPVPDCVLNVYPYKSSRCQKTVISDKDGQFEIEGLFAEKTQVIAEKSKFSPEMAEILIQNPMPDVKIVLKPGKTLRGYVVDPNGNSLEGTFIAATQIEDGPPLSWWQATDKEGKFCWDAAPEELVSFDFLKSGYIALPHIVLSAANYFEYEIVLYPALHIQGTIIDAQTSQPIPTFTVRKLCISPNSANIYWLGDQEENALDISIDWVFLLPNEQYILEQFQFQIEILAGGYAPVKSEVWPIGTKEQTVRLALNKINILEGFVYTPEGKSAVGAVLFVANPEEHFMIERDIACSFYFFKTAQSDICTSEDGHYIIYDLPENSEIIIKHDSGFAQVTRKDLPQNGIIQLQPWSRVEGVAYFEGKPAANEQIQIIDKELYRHFLRLTTCDSEGRFVFEKVPPSLEMSVSGYNLPREVPASQHNKIHNFDPVNLKTRPGQTENITLGTSGQTVTGHFLLPKDPNFPKKWGENCTAFLLQLPPSPQIQENLESSNLRGPIAHPFSIDPNGSFLIYNVFPGNYNLCAFFNMPYTFQPGTFSQTQPLWGKIELPLEIKEIDPNGRPLELGELEIIKINYPSIGQKAFDFSVHCVDGIKFHLSEQKDKFVLIYFLNIELSSIDNQYVALQDILSVYADNPQFKVISLSTKPDLEEGLTVEQFLQNQKIFWPVAIIPDSQQDNKDPISKRYGMSDGMVGWFLIGPDQKLIASSPNGDNLAEKLSRVLSK